MIVANLVTTDRAWIFSGLSGGSGGVADDAEAVGTGVEIDAESTIIGGIGGHGGCADLVASDRRARLIGEGVDAAGVVELAGIVGDAVLGDGIAMHSCVVWCPAPADTDTRVVQVTDIIAFDEAVADIAAADADSTPVLLRGVGDDVVANGNIVALRGKVSVGAVYLAGTLGKGTGEDGGAANVVERTTGNVAALNALDVKGRRTEVTEDAALEYDALGMTHGNGTDGALNPCLVLETFVPWQAFMFFQFVGVDKWETALQRYMALVQRAVPAGILEGKTLDGDQFGAVDD